VTNPKNEKLHDLTPREVLTFAPLLIMAFWIGLYPKPFFQILEQPVNHLVATMHRDSQPEGTVSAEVQPAGSSTAATTTALANSSAVPAVPAASTIKGKN